MKAVAVVLLVLVVLLAWRAMYLGWRRRAAGQALGPLPVAPDDAGRGGVPVVPGTYVSTTSAGDWLDRVTAARLGARGRVDVVVEPRGVLLERVGAPKLWLPRSSVVAVRRQRGLAGTFVEKDGVVVLTWRLGERELDTGVRPRHRRDRARLVAAVEQLIAGPAPAPASGTGQP